MSKFQKELLKVVKKMVDADVKKEKFGGWPPDCPLIFHQPKRPEKKNQ